MTSIRAGAVIAIVCVAATLFTEAQSAVTDRLREYPSFDQQVAAMVRRGQMAKDAARLRVEAPLAPRTFELLVQTDRINDALALLPRALDVPVDDLEAMLGAVASQMSAMRRDDTRGYSEVVNRALESVRRRLTVLPREDAARIAFALLPIDGEMAGGGSRAWNERTRQFVEEYSGTGPALLAEVDSIAGDASPLPVRIDRLERFRSEHPGTTAAAKALKEIGSHFAHNAYNGLEARGADPTNRLLRIVEIVKELESGRYPASRWTSSAVELVSGTFYTPDAIKAIPPESVTRMLDAYYDVVRTHFDVRREDAVDSSIGYIVTSKMADLFARQGRAIDGVERTLARLETDTRNAAEVRWFRALYYARQWTGGPQESRAEMREKARQSLAAIADDGRDYRARKALATLAAMASYERDFKQALPLYRRYLAAYPDSAWAWIAALRIGEAHQALGDWRRAAAACDDGVRRYGAAEAPALVIGSTCAARAYEALGEFDIALDRYRRAVAGWDPGYGIEYVFAGARQPSSTPAADDESRRPIRREALAERIASLESILRSPGGALIERGRWLIGQRRFADARAALQDFARAHSSSPLMSEARLLMHRAMFERALELAAADKPTRDDAAAMKALDELSRAEPFDMGVALGRMARSAILARQGQSDDARNEVRQTFDRLVTQQAPLRAQVPATPLDADIAAIRSLVFRPLGDLDLLRSQSWSAHAFPATLPPFVVLPADIAIKLSAGQQTRRVYQSLPGIDRVVFLTRDELATLERALMTIGGTGAQQRASVMQIFSNLGPDARVIGKLWGEVFPTQPGHWGGIVLQTYPMITRIDFLDDGRTEANALFTIGYSGATMVLEKVNGAWRAVRVTGWWIT